MTVGTLGELAAWPGMPSSPSLRRFIAARPDFPVLQRGRFGLAYKFDLETAAAFVTANWRDGRRMDDDHEAVRQLPLALGGEGVGND